MIFFNPSTYVVDLLDGVIDIHNHLLPYLDDGAQDLSESNAIIEKMRECNISRAIATPHMMEDFYDLDRDKIAASYRSLRESVDDDKKHFLQNYAAEYMIDHRFLEMSCHRDLLLVCDRHILVEFSYFRMPDFVTQVAFNLSNLDLTPILAHPERYSYISSMDSFEDLKKLKFKYQLNLLALSGHYGSKSLQNSLKLLENGRYDFIGTDAHKPSHLEVLKKTKIKRKFKQYFENLILKHKEVIG
ncbi:MAG: CpsB/CapC family capsule biosynthesis tyrosine phosphatase [Nonlabens sp.]